MLVYRAVGHAVFIDAEPDQERRLNSGRVKSEKVERGDSVSEQFQHCRRRSQSCGSKMDRQQRAMQKPRGNRGCPNQHARIGREQSSEDRRAKNEDAGRNAQELIECAGEKLSRRLPGHSGFAGLGGCQRNSARQRRTNFVDESTPGRQPDLPASVRRALSVRCRDLPRLPLGRRRIGWFAFRHVRSHSNPSDPRGPRLPV